MGEYDVYVAVDNWELGIGSVELAQRVNTPADSDADSRDCKGIWSTCDANCYQSYTILQYAFGNGAGCESVDGEEKTCLPGEGDCPASSSGSINGGTSSGTTNGATSSGIIPSGGIIPSSGITMELPYG